MEVSDIQAKIVMLVAQMQSGGQSEYGMGQIAAYADVARQMQIEDIKDNIKEIVEAVGELRAMDTSYLSAEDTQLLNGFLAMMPDFGIAGQVME